MSPVVGIRLCPWRTVSTRHASLRGVFPVVDTWRLRLCVDGNKTRGELPTAREYDQSVEYDIGARFYWRVAPAYSTASLWQCEFRSKIASILSFSVSKNDGTTCCYPSVHDRAKWLHLAYMTMPSDTFPRGTIELLYSTIM